MASTYETVAGIISDTCDIDASKITPDSHAINDLGIHADQRHLAAEDYGVVGARGSRPKQCRDQPYTTTPGHTE